MARHAFWVILAGTTPTAFRAGAREVLLPTLHQLQRTQPDVTLQWFEGGKLWASPEQALEARRNRRAREQKPPGWRPGGVHRDPRARFKLTRDQKRARFKRQRMGKRPAGAGGAHGKPRGPKGRPGGGRSNGGGR